MTSAIQKTIVEKREDLLKYLDRIELIYYDNEYTDDEEDNKIHEKIYEDLIVNDTKGVEICRNLIAVEYIQDVFLDEDIMGYIAKVDGEYAGFIMFKQPDKDINELYLSLVATKPKLGFPLGKMLISIMEQTAKESNIHTILADSVEGAIEFYMKNDWEVLDKDEDDETYLIEKQIREKTPQEIEQDEEEEYEVDFGDFNNFEEYSNSIIFDDEFEDEWEDRPSYLQRILDYSYSYF